MALSSSRLAASIRAKLLADPNSHALDNEALTALCQAIAEALIEEVTTHGVVSPLGLPTPLTAPPGGGPVTGTGKIE